jgi:purine-nucleoside phosphorylase
MIDFISKIKGSASVIKSLFPKKFSADLALIKSRIIPLPKGINILGEVKYSDIPHFEITRGSKTGSVLFCRSGNRDLIVYNGRLHYYDGSSMRSIAHKIYVLKFLGIKKILSIDEVGHLDPRFKCGELAMIYDHINLMGDNPLIGKNEDSLGVRFPDMSNAYDKTMFSKIVSVLTDTKMRVNESVYLGITGPNSETDAEARFYREAGCDVLGYSVVPENITAVHAGVKFAAIGLITRELVADKMMEETRSDKELETQRLKSFTRSSIALSQVLQGIIKII